MTPTTKPQPSRERAIELLQNYIARGMGKESGKQLFEEERAEIADIVDGIIEGTITKAKATPLRAAASYRQPPPPAVVPADPLHTDKGEENP